MSEGPAIESIGTRDWGDLVAPIGKAVLVYCRTGGGDVHSVSVVDGALRRYHHGSEEGLSAEVDRLRYCLARLASSTNPAAKTAFARVAMQVAAAVEQRLLASVLPALRQGRDLVVVPVGRLHLLPWAALPHCRGNAVTVAPSLRWWLGARGAPRPCAGRLGRLWVAGPGLRHARREVRRLRAGSGGRLLLGREATVEHVLGALDGAATAHIAAHGRFREDRPLLSFVELADGRLYGHHLASLRRAPVMVVLSACEVGRSGCSRSDRLSGFAAALFERGSQTVIASTVAVRDERAAAVMVSLHSELRCGLTPAAALGRAQARHGETGFICLGYGG